MDQNQNISVAPQIWLNLEALISEGISMPFVLAKDQKSAFGRYPSIVTNGDLDFAVGMSANGLRAASWLSNDTIDQSCRSLQHAVRNLHPVVAVASAKYVHLLATTGAFILRASSTQELLDFTLIAHCAAEQALIPGIVLFDASETDQEASLPDKNLMITFLGDADSRISSPTESQQMLFGKTRRRIPRFFHVDIPVMTGATKTSAGTLYEQAAYQAYFMEHLDHILTETLVQFAHSFGRTYQPYQAHHIDRSSILLICDHPAVYDRCMDLKSKARMGQILLKQWAPLPKTLSQNLDKLAVIGILEAPISGQSFLADQCRKQMAHTRVPIYSANYARIPTTSQLQNYVHRLETQQLPEGSFWLDVAFFNSHSEFPKKQVLMQDVLRAYPELAQRQNVHENTPADKPIHFPERIPISLRKYQEHGPAYSRLSHFFDTTSFFYETTSGEWTADPFQSFPVIPPGSADFGQAARERTQLPFLDTARCTGCGDCFLHCPNSAMPSLALNFESFIQSGIQQAQSKGQSITQLFPHVKNMAKSANSYVLSQKETVLQNRSLSLADILNPSFEDFLIKGKHTEEKEKVLRQEFSVILDQIGNFQIVFSDLFFHDARKELFGLAIDLNACTGCGICSQVCSEGALQLIPESSSIRQKMVHQWSLWEQMPDTSGDTIQYLMDESNYPSLSALMLSRNYYASLIGATKPATISARTVIHLVTTVAEAMGQRGTTAMLDQLEALMIALNNQLKAELSNALPDLDPVVMSGTLQKMATARLTLDELLQESRSAGHGRLLDKASLQRKLALLKQVSDLRELIGTGAQGTGRARYAVALDQSLATLADFPLNPFTVPVLTYDGNSLTMMRGLIQGHLRHFLDNLKILRRAKLEQNNGYNPIIHDAQIASLRWSDLTLEEQAMAPPLLLFAGQNLMHHAGSGQLAQLLDDGFPVKLILLDDGNPSSDTGLTNLLNGSTSMIPLMALGNVQVLQSSLANPDHLFEGLVSAFGKSEPAVIRLLAPSARSGNRQMLYQLALESRTWIHLNYRPDRISNFTFPKLNLDTNPAREEPWVTRTIRFGSDDEPQEISYELTVADWLYAQPHRHYAFDLYQDEMGTALPVADFLRLEPADRDGKIPVVIRINDQNEMVRYRVSDSVVKVTAAGYRTWMTLREVAGELTEFPEKIFAKAEQEIALRYEAEKKKLLEEYEQQLRDLEGVHLEKVRSQIKSRLMQLAGIHD